MYRRSGRDHCSGDNLNVTENLFNSIIELEDLDRDLFDKRLSSLQNNDAVFDLFMSHWERKKKDDSVSLKCIHSKIKPIVAPTEAELPMAKPYIPFPDLVEVYIAEIMLGRELTNLEKDGSRYIPKINEEGKHYFAPLTWVTYPHSYMTLKDMTVKTDYEAEPLDQIFDIKSIRGIYSNRKGDIIDE